MLLRVGTLLANVLNSFFAIHKIQYGFASKVVIYRHAIETNKWNKAKRLQKQLQCPHKNCMWSNDELVVRGVKHEERKNLDNEWIKKSSETSSTKALSCCAKMVISNSWVWLATIQCVCVRWLCNEAPLMAGKRDNGQFIEIKRLRNSLIQKSWFQTENLVLHGTVATN